MLPLHPLLYKKKRKYCEHSITRIKKNLFCCMYLHYLLIHKFRKVLSFHYAHSGTVMPLHSGMVSFLPMILSQNVLFLHAVCEQSVIYEGIGF